MNPEQLAKKGSEYAHQVALFAWCALNKEKYPELDLIFAIKNEEKSGSLIVGARQKAAGCKKGVADIFLPVARKNVHGLFIEMKKLDGKPSKEQIEFGKKVIERGYGFSVCYGWEDAKNLLEWYLSIEN